MIRLAIVEDEASYRDTLTQYVRRYARENGQDIMITCFSDGDEIVEGYNCAFDIILMDIQMRFMDGMKAAEEIRRQDADVIIMFITNMTDYAIRGYQVDALDYILKPVSYFAFSSRLDRALRRLDKKDNKSTLTISLRSGGTQKVDVNDILYIESNAHVLVFHTRDGDFETYGKMMECEEKLVKYGFFRSNKGYLVNLRHVDGVREGACIVGGQSLVISRARKKEFMTALTDYMGDL